MAARGDRAPEDWPPSGLRAEPAGWTRPEPPGTMSRKGDTRGIRMWVSKPIYESLPYFYLLVGLLSLAASLYLNYWIWPEVCFAIGLLCLVGGLVVLLRRRDHRDQHRRAERTEDFL